MFTKWLIRLGLIATPFLVMAGRDLRDIKLDIAGIVALGIGLSAIYEYGIKPHRNKWLMFFIWGCCSFYFITPVCPIKMFGIDASLFWVWKSMYYFVVFGLMYYAISSIDFKLKDLSKILKIMTWCGTAMAIYLILQSFHIDQIFVTINDDTFGHMGGFIGNFTQVAPFIAMIIPVCLYLRRWTMSVIMVIAVIITTSQVAIGAMIISLLGYFMVQNKKALKWGSLVAIMAILVLVIGLKSGKIPFDDHERVVMWKQIVKDVNTPQMYDNNVVRPMTGWGLGTFKYVFNLQHKNSFQQAHNEYIELLYNVGIIGIFLFMMALWVFLRGNFHFREIVKVCKRKPFYGLRTALLASFVCMIVTAGGTFIFQIGTTVWYTVFVCGLLSNIESGGLT